MKKKKLMILGAGIYQVPLIKKARALGLETIVCSVPGRYPGKDLADRFYPLDTTDGEGILSLARALSIDGITTSGTDVAVASIGLVCDEMGLCGIPLEAARRATDKALMKEAFARCGVSTARHMKAYSLEEAARCAEELGYPVVIKPVDSSGSRGVRRLNDPRELPAAWEQAAARSRKPYLLLEEFIDADEIGVDAFVGEDDFLAFLPHTKFTCTTADNVSIPAGHRFPFSASPALLAELRSQVLRGARALGLKNCPLNADVFVKGESVWIIEIGGRTGATCIPELISISQGYNWYENLILCALGETPSFAPRAQRPCMARLLFSPVDGTITHIDTQKTASLSGEADIQIDYPAGTAIDAVHNATDRIGHVIAATDDPAVLDRIVREAAACITLDAGNLADLLRSHPLSIRTGLA